MKQLKTIKIKGRDYVQVSERLRYLREEFEGDYELVSEATFYPEHSMWMVKATLTLCIQDKCYTYTGHANEIIGEGMVNKTSALENCETSAWGRACAAAGIGVEATGGIASAEEMGKFMRNGKKNGKVKLVPNTKAWIKIRQRIEGGECGDDMWDNIDRYYEVSDEDMKELQSYMP